MIILYNALIYIKIKKKGILLCQIIDVERQIFIEEKLVILMQYIFYIIKK